MKPRPPKAVDAAALFLLLFLLLPDDPHSIRG